MEKNYTHISILLDKSGSMDSIKEDIIGGFNSYIKSQKELPGKLTVTLNQFSGIGYRGLTPIENTGYVTTYNMVDVKEVEALTTENFIPSGGTALYDAAVQSIKDTGKSLADLDESKRPEKVLFVIITDGGENSSVLETKDSCFELIAHQEQKYNWEFVYLGANQDAFAVGSGIGVSKGFNYTADTLGIKKMFSAHAKATSSYRSASVATFNMTQKDIDDEIVS